MNEHRKESDYRKETDYIVVHCSATKASMNHLDAKEIDQWHRERGWRKIGYHWVIRRDGIIEQGRELDEVGAHVKGFNFKSIGICMVGGLDKDGNPASNYTDKQWKSLTSLVRQMRLLYSNAEVIGHCDFPNVKKACPCFDVRKWWTKAMTWTAIHPE